MYLFCCGGGDCCDYCDYCCCCSCCCISQLTTTNTTKYRELYMALSRTGAPPTCTRGHAHMRAHTHTHIRARAQKRLYKTHTHARLKQKDIVIVKVLDKARVQPPWVQPYTHARTHTRTVPLTHPPPESSLPATFPSTPPVSWEGANLIGRKRSNPKSLEVWQCWQYWQCAVSPADQSLLFAGVRTWLLDQSDKLVAIPTHLKKSEDGPEHVVKVADVAVFPQVARRCLTGLEKSISKV